MNPATSLSKNALLYGLIGGFAMIVYTLVLYILDLTFWNPIITSYVIGTALMILFMMLGTKTMRDKWMNGSISYGKAFLSAFLIGLFTMIISLIFSNLLTYFIDPDLQTKALEYGAEKMMSSGKFTQEQMDAAMEQQKAMASKPALIAVGQVFAVIFMGIISAIIALVTAAIQKREGDPFESAMSEVEEQK